MISVIIDHNNNILQSPYDIASSFINYFSNIFTSSKPNLDISPPLHNNLENMIDLPTMLDEK